MGNEEIDLEEQVQNKKCGCSHKKKERSKGEAKKLINRLNRIEGQVRGIKRMLEQDAYCTDILIQVSSTKNCWQNISALVWQKTSGREKMRRSMNLW